jgi:hypothetical protein
VTPIRRGVLRALGFLCALVLLLGVAALVVFRTDLLLASLDVGPLGSEADAQHFLDEVGAFHGAPERWASQPAIEMKLRGSVPFTPARLAFGLEESDVLLTLRFEPGVHGVYDYTLQDGDQTRRGRVDTRQDRDATGLVLDSVRHLFELPFVAASVPYRRGLPSVAGRRRAFFTWGDPPTATSAYDQIVVWHEGGQVVRMDTTGRDIAPFIVARVEWDGRVELGGFVLPRRAAVYNDGRDGAVVHAWALISAEFTPK